MFFLCLVATANVFGRILTIATWAMANPLAIFRSTSISHVVVTVVAVSMTVSITVDATFVFIVPIALYFAKVSVD